MMWKTRLRSELDNLMAITAGLGPSVTLLHGVGLNADAWGGQIDTLANYFLLRPLICQAMVEAQDWMCRART